MNRAWTLFLALGFFASVLIADASETSSFPQSEISCREDWAHPWNLRIDVRKRYGAWQTAEVKTVYGEDTVYGKDYGEVKVSHFRYISVDSVSEQKEGSRTLLTLLGNGLKITVDVTHDLSQVSGDDIVLRDWYAATVDAEIPRSSSGSTYKRHKTLCYVK